MISNRQNAEGTIERYDLFSILLDRYNEDEELTREELLGMFFLISKEDFDLTNK
jgi:hypothetical protein